MSNVSIQAAEGRTPSLKGTHAHTPTGTRTRERGGSPLVAAPLHSYNPPHIQRKGFESLFIVIFLIISVIFTIYMALIITIVFLPLIKAVGGYIYGFRARTVY